VVVFAFYSFEKPPILFKPGDLARIQTSAADYAPIARSYETAFEKRREAARQVVEARQSGASLAAPRDAYRQAQQEFDEARRSAIRLAQKTGSSDTGAGNRSFLAPIVRYLPAAGGFSDTNYVFLTFVMRYLPAGVVGLMLVMIFGAAMTSISAEMNSLATVTVIDLYQRHVCKRASDAHYLKAAKVATVFWGLYAVLAASLATNLGSLIEAINVVGSLFYGGLLGVFVLAFFFKRVGGTAAFTGVLAGEAAIFASAAFTGISFLWYNVIGCLVVVATALALSFAYPAQIRPVAAPDRVV